MQWAAISEKETRLICVILMHAISALNLGKKMEFLKSDLKLKFVLRFDHLVSVFDETSCFNQSERALFQKFAIFKQPNSFSMFPWPDQIAKTNDKPMWHVHMDFGESPRQPFPSIELFLRNTCESKTFQSCLHIPA